LPTTSLDEDMKIAARPAANPGAPFSPRSTSERMVDRILRLIDRKDADLSSIIGSAQGLDDYISTRLPLLDDGELRHIASRCCVVLGNIHSRLTGRQEFRGSDWRLMLFCLVSSRTLREAIQRIGDVFEAADGRMGSIELTEERGKAFAATTGTRGDDLELAFTVTLNSMILFHEIFGWIVGTPLRGKAHLDFPETCRAWVDEAILPFELKLAADRCGLDFAASHLDLPIIRTVEDCEPQINVSHLFSYTETGEAQDIAQRAQRVLRAALQEDRRLPSLDGLSGMLGLGRMTLRRRLNAAGTSFNELKDAVRRDMALELLTRTDHSIEDLTERLDFCDSDAFRLAMKTWTGMSPTDYRKGARKLEVGA
jgi:AraC-like DNA-binding protein